MGWPLTVLSATAALQTEGLMRALTEVEMPLVSVLQQMEAVGIAVDTSIFQKHKVGSWSIRQQLAKARSQEQM